MKGQCSKDFTITTIMHVVFDRSQPASKERIPFVVSGVQNCLVLTFPYPEPVPKKLCDFYWL